MYGFISLAAQIILLQQVLYASQGLFRLLYSGYAGTVL